MSDRIELARSYLPWAPPGAEAVATFNYYDMPLVGIVRQHGVPYLFTCITGQLEDLNLWLYVTLSDAEATAMLDAPDRATLDRLAGEAVQLGGIMAVADESGLVVWVETGENVGERLIAEMKAERERLDRDADRLPSLV